MKLGFNRKPQGKLTLTIPSPCREDWDKMTPNEKGRHCGNCDKTVIDFSLYSDKELLSFFKNNNNQSICAHIPLYNLNREISVNDMPNRSLWHKLFFGTALASWLGLATKADAQKATPHPVIMQNNKDYTKGKVAEVVPDTSKNYVQFTFLDSASRKAVPNVDITLSGENFTRYYSTDKNTYKVYIPQDQVGKTLTFTFVTYEYGAREIQITTQKLPLRKKILLQFVGPKVMVNGGLGIRYEEKK